MSSNYKILKSLELESDKKKEIDSAEKEPKISKTTNKVEQQHHKTKASKNSKHVPTSSSDASAHRLMVEREDSDHIVASFIQRRVPLKPEDSEKDFWSLTSSLGSIAHKEMVSDQKSGGKNEREQKRLMCITSYAVPTPTLSTASL